MSDSMCEDLLVSVLVPVYNVGPYLREALESVLSQTHHNLEVILVDDGSTDESGEICDAFAERDSRVIVIHQENQGVSAARNAALDAMTGSYVAFIDPDDACEPTFVEELLEALVRTRADVAVCRYRIVVGKGTLRAMEGSRPIPDIEAGSYGHVESLRALADYRIDASLWNKLYRRGLWERIRFPVGYVNEDLDVIPFIFELCECVTVIDSSLYLYRKRPGSITSTESTENSLDILLAQLFFCMFVAENTPEVFSKEELLRRHATLLKRMTTAYMRLRRTRSDELRLLCRDLRAYVVEESHRMERLPLSAKARMTIRMLELCPRLLCAAYPIYWHAKKLVYGYGK